MNLREQEYQELGLTARWLRPEHAKHAYEYALKFSSEKRYGLNECTVVDIEKHIIEGRSVADAWLKERLSSQGTVQVVYGDDDVCVIDAKAFIDNWQEIFVPPRDDAVVLHNLDKTVIFYCHEEELEVGTRNA